MKPIKYIAKALLAFCLIFPLFVSGQMIYQDNFNTGPYGYPYTILTGQAASDISNTSWTNSQGAWTTYDGTSGKALAIHNSSFATTTLTLTFDVTPGSVESISSFSFAHRSSSTGYSTWAMAINGNNVGNGAIFVDQLGSDNSLHSTGIVNVPTIVTSLTGTVTVTLTLSGGSHGSTGTFRFDDFTLFGAVSPSSPNFSGVSFINPSCGGTDGSISLNGLFPDNIYTVNYNNNGVAQSPVNIQSTNTGAVVLLNLAAGNYTNINVSYNGVTSPNVYTIQLAGNCAGDNTPQNVTGPSGTQTNTITLPTPYDANNSLFNYVRTWVPNQSVTNTNDLQTTVQPVNNYINAKMNTNFIDGFGRSMENIIRYNADNNDLVQFSDNRPSVNSNSFLSYSQSANSTFRYSPFTEQQTYYNNKFPNEGNTALSMTAYGSTANDRTTNSYMPGLSFVGQLNGTHATTQVNIAADIIMWGYDNVNNLPVNNGYYQANQLTESISYNTSDGTETDAYTDNDGNKVCTRQVSYVLNGNVNTRQYLTTYYIYDNLGRVVMTIPPKATNAIIAGTASMVSIRDQLCNYSMYDNEGRLYQQHIPGQYGDIYYVYDAKFRKVLMQTPNMRSEDEWEFTLYDSRDRVKMTGIIQDVSLQGSASSLQSKVLNPSSAFPSAASAFDNLFYYIAWLNGEDLYSLTLQNCNIEEYFYYDNYNHAGSTTFDVTKYGNYSFAAVQGVLQPLATTNVDGRLTGKQIKITDGSSGSTLSSWITETYYYDRYGHLLQTNATNAQGGTDITSTQYNFCSQPIVNVLVHNNPLCTSKPSTVIAQWTTAVTPSTNVDHIQQLIDGPLTTLPDYNAFETLIKYDYDDLGMLSAQHIGNTAELQQFGYNIRGQITGINADYAENNINAGQITFGESLKYDYGFAQNQLNGNLAGIIWRGTNGSERAYAYSYDKQNQLTYANYNEYKVPVPGAFATWNKTHSDYTVSGLAYDANGNITSMNQMGVSATSNPQVQPVDQLHYQYMNNGLSNQLQSVSDDIIANYHLGDFVDNSTTAYDYGYDEDGNLNFDANKNSTGAQYDPFFNKPVQVSVNNGAQNIYYAYDAEGNQVREVVDNGTTTTTFDYIGPFVYKDNVLQYARGSYGRQRYHSNQNGTMAWDYDYFVKDHLGNVRSVVTKQELPSQTYVATYEVSNATAEDQLFDGIETARDNSQQPTSGNEKAARLNSSETDRIISAAIMLPVSAGDVINASTQYYYNTYTATNDNPLSPNNMMNSIISSLTAGNASFIGPDGVAGPQVISEAFSSGNYINIYSQLEQQEVDPSKPHAYLNYLVYDNNMNLTQQSDMVQVGTDGGGTLAMSSPLTINQNGYVVIYVSNESNSDVYFDDVTINASHSPLLEEQQYYPYGLAVNNATSNPLVDKQCLYQGNECDNELGQNWDDFHARNYDPQLGRFNSLDPAGQFASGYVGMGNMPSSAVDPNGQWALGDDLIAMLVGGVINLGSNLISGNVHSWGQAGGYFLVGAATGEASLYGGPIAGGAVAGAGNNLVQQLSSHNKFDPNSLAISTVVGAGTGAVSLGTSNLIAPAFSSISSPVLSNIASQSVSGAVSGFAVGVGTSVLQGGSDFHTTISNGLNNAGFGAALGTITGGISGIQQANNMNVNPWTGASNDEGIQPLPMRPLEQLPTNTSVNTSANQDGIEITNLDELYGNSTPDAKRPFIHGGQAQFSTPGVDGDQIFTNITQDATPLGNNAGTMVLDDGTQITLYNAGSGFKTILVVYPNGDKYIYRTNRY